MSHPEVAYRGLEVTFAAQFIPIGPGGLVVEPGSQYAGDILGQPSLITSAFPRQRASPHV